MASRSPSWVAVSLEVTPKRVFASAIDWPGWSRSAKDEELALDALGRYAERYRPIVGAAGARLLAGAAERLEVVERVAGSSGTEFGIPYTVTDLDRLPLTRSRAKREAAIVEAAWDHLDRVIEHAPAELRKGPRGGGRARDKIGLHCREADEGYAQAMGIRPSEVAPKGEDRQLPLRAAVLEILRRPSDGSPIGGKKWPPRYAARRIAWHTLDHAWEIEDRSTEPVDK